MMRATVAISRPHGSCLPAGSSSGFSAVIRSLGALVLMAAVGCSSLDVPLLSHEKIPRATAEDPVVRIVCLWEAAEGKDMQSRPCRGFAGQILFLTRDQKTPVAVDGEVSIYVFDDQGSIEEQARPLHRFVFRETWPRYLHETQLGPAYHIFIPYTRPGLHEADCTLVVQLKPDSGQTVRSEMAHVRLPGTKKSSADASGDNTSAGSIRAGADGRTSEPAPPANTNTPADDRTAESNRPRSAGLSTRTWSALAEAEKTPNQHTADPETTTDEALKNRIAHLEALLQRLLQERAAAPVPAVSDSPIIEASAERIATKPPKASDSPAPPLRRFRLRPAEPVAVPHPPKATHPLAETNSADSPPDAGWHPLSDRTSETNESARARSASVSDSPQPGSLQPADPVDDGSPAESTQGEAHSSHPLLLEQTDASPPDAQDRSNQPDPAPTPQTHTETHPLLAHPTKHATP